MASKKRIERENEIAETAVKLSRLIREIESTRTYIPDIDMRKYVRSQLNDLKSKYFWISEAATKYNYLPYIKHKLDTVEKGFSDLEKGIEELS